MLHQKRQYFFGMLFIVGQSAGAQNRTDLEGRVYSDEGDVSGTHIVNQTTQRATIADLNGFFLFRLASTIP